MTAARNIETEAQENLPPRQATTLLGHEATEALLLEQWQAGRLPGAWMIAGPKGIGKATLAYRLARFVLFQGEKARADSGGLFGDALPSAPPETLDIPTDSPVFSRVAAGSHTDLLSIEPPWDPRKKALKSEIPVEEARKVGGFLSLTAGESDWRVVIVDAADQLNANAANALLKWLEEPPPQSLFLLVTHNPGAVLPTLRSRCRVLHLAVPQPAAFAEILQQLVPHAGQEEVAWLHVLSGGSPGLSVTLHEQGAVPAFQALLTLLAEGRAGELPALLKRVDQLVGAKSALEFPHVAGMLRRLTACVVTTAGGKPPETAWPDALQQAVRAIAAAKPLDYWLDLWENGNQLLADTERLYLDKRQATRTLLEALAGRGGV